MIATRRLGENSHYATPGHKGGRARPPVSRFAGQDDTLNPSPIGMGAENGYMGRDVTASVQPYNAQPGMFRRLHTGAGG